MYRIRVFILYISISYLHSYDFVPSYFLRISFSFQPFITGSIGRDHRVNPFSMLKNSWVPGSTTSLLLDSRHSARSGIGATGPVNSNPAFLFPAPSCLFKHAHSALGNSRRAMSEPAPAASQQQKPRSGGGGSSRACYKCGKPGHWSRDCTAPREEWIPQQPRETNTQVGAGLEDEETEARASKPAAPVKKSNRRPKFTVSRHVRVTPRACLRRPDAFPWSHRGPSGGGLV